MSGGQIGTAIGFVAGFFLPGGPQVWAAIGGTIGGIVDPTVIEGPKVGEVPQQTSQEGVSRPIVYARSQPMAGQIIITAPPNIVTRFESQGKGGPKVKRQVPYRTYAIGVCRGPGVVLLQAWRNGKLVYDVESPDMAANNAEFEKYVRWHDGSYDQLPDPDQEAKHGVGIVHAYRGTAYASIFEENVDDNGGAMSQWMWRVARFTDAPAGLWWAVRPRDLITRVLWRSDDALSFGAAEDRGPPNIQFNSAGDRDCILRTESGSVIIYSSNPDIEIYRNYTQETLPAPSIVTITDGEEIRRIRDFNGVLVATTGTDSYYVSVNDGDSWDKFEMLDGLSMHDIGRLESGRWGTYIQQDADQRFVFCDDEIPIEWSEGDSGGIYPSNAQGSICSTGQNLIMLGTLGRVFKTGNGSVWTSTGTDEVDRQNGRCNNHANGIAMFCDPNSFYVVRSPDGGATWESIPISEQVSKVDYGNGQWVLSGEAGSQNIFVSTQDGEEGTWDQVEMPSSIGFDQTYKVGFVDPPFSYADGFMPLRAIVEELSEEVGATDHVDASGLDGIQCRGFTVTSRYPCYSAMQSLSSVFFFSPFNSEGKIRFRLMGEDTVATVVESDMIDDGDDDRQDETRRGDTVSIPRVLHMVYYDVAGGLATDKQSSERPEGTKSVGEQSVSTSIVLSANEAATVIAKQHAMLAVRQKGEITFSLPDNWLRLTESDPVFVPDGGKMVRAVIQQVDTEDGQQNYRAIRDRQSIHSMSVEGIPAAPITPPPSSVSGPTLLEVVDIPLWRDQDDRLGFYVAVSGVFEAWPGAFVELSLDSGATYIDGNATNVSAVMGSLTSTLSDHPQEFPDEVNTFQVSISTPFALLEGTDLSGMLNGRNLAVIGDELIQFANPDEVSEGVWDISYLLRGRKGTETSAHLVGDRFVLLDSAVFFIDAQLAWRNRSLTFRATTFDTPVEDSTIVTIMFVGQNQIERQAAYLSARRESGDAVISWQGVGRLGAGVNAAQGVNFIGFRITLTDGTVTQTFDQTEDSLTTSLSSFTGPVTVSVQQRNSITGLGPTIEVII